MIKSLRCNYQFLPYNAIQDKKVVTLVFEKNKSYECHNLSVFENGDVRHVSSSQILIAHSFSPLDVEKYFDSDEKSEEEETDLDDAEKEYYNGTIGLVKVLNRIFFGAPKCACFSSLWSSMCFEGLLFSFNRQMRCL